MSGEKLFMHLNIRSLRKNWDAFLVYISGLNKLKPCGFILTEVNIHQDEAAFYEIEGYQSYVLLRDSRRGGGIMIYLRDDISAVRVYRETESFELIQLNTIIDDYHLRIISIYRPPNLSKNRFLEELEYLISENCSGETIILGDINIDIKDKQNISSIKYNDILASFGFMSIINSFTREEIKQGLLSQSSIDHIFYNGNLEGVEGIVVKINYLITTWLALD